MSESHERENKVDDKVAEGKKTVTTNLRDDDLDVVSGGENVVNEVYASNSIVVRHKDTGKVLFVLPY